MWNIACHYLSSLTRDAKIFLPTWALPCFVIPRMICDRYHENLFGCILLRIIYTYVIYVYAATYISKWFAKQPWGNCARLKLEKLPRSCSPVSIHNCYIPLSKGGKTLMKCRDNECINFRCASICGIQPSPVFVYYQIFGWFYVEIGSKKNLLEVSDVITR